MGSKDLSSHNTLFFFIFFFKILKIPIMPFSSPFMPRPSQRRQWLQIRSSRCSRFLWNPHLPRQGNSSVFLIENRIHLIFLININWVCIYLFIYFYVWNECIGHLDHLDAVPFIILTSFLKRGISHTPKVALGFFCRWKWRKIMKPCKK